MCHFMWISSENKHWLEKSTFSELQKSSNIPANIYVPEMYRPTLTIAFILLVSTLVLRWKSMKNT